MTRLILFLGAALVAAPTFGQLVEIPAVVDPPQPLKAVVVTTTDGAYPVELRNGKAFVPANSPLPWTVTSARFEPTTYTQSDFDQHRPLIVRELGQLRGSLTRSNPPQEEHFTLLLRRAGANSAEQLQFVAAVDGSFNARTPAGQYEAVAIGETSGTRIRSGIVIAPGKTTDLGALLCAPTVRLSLRVIDAKRHAPVAGAKVEWDPPDILNADSAKVLYARQWSAVADRQGIVTLGAVGPIPIALRWRVQAPGYAITRSRTVEVHEPKPVSVPDIALQLEAAVIVRVTLPRDPGELKNAALVLSSNDERNSLQYVPTGVRVPFRDGELKLQSATYGKKRLTVETDSGKTLLYRDFVIETERTIVNLAPVPAEIFGRAMRKDKAQAGLYVRVTDPHDSRLVLAMTRTDADGRYHLKTYQSGRTHVYAIQSNTAGHSFGAVTQWLDLNGAAMYQADFEFSGAGGNIRVVDATNDRPLHATVDERLEFTAGGGSMGTRETDKDGVLTLDAYPEGMAHLTISAVAYRAKSLDVALTKDASETVIKLDRAAMVDGKVVDVNGAPVPRARISGGYTSELEAQGHYEAVTDDDGRFHFDAAPEIGTVFYVAAARHALGIITLEPGQDNTIRLQPPGRGAVVLLPNNAPPTRRYLVSAAPVGGDFIPFGALEDLGEVNGLSSFQLLGTARDGTVVLPEFLQPGKYNLYVAVKRSGTVVYDKVGMVSMPSEKGVMLTDYKEH